MKTRKTIIIASVATLSVVMTAQNISQAQQKELGPKVEKTYGEGLPRDAATLTFADDQYPSLGSAAN